MGYSKVNVHDLEPAGPGGAVRFVRRDQEEVNVIVRRSGTYVIEGDEIPISEGDVFRFDPETTRGPKAGPEGLTMVVVGLPRGSYEPRRPF